MIDQDREKIDRLALRSISDRHQKDRDRSIDRDHFDQIANTIHHIDKKPHDLIIP